jgi:Carboxypeptidase regulatory-like domain
MRLNRLRFLCLCVVLLSAAAPTYAQDFRGRINGTVTDNTGAILPGVTVTASSPALIQPQVQVTGADGTYRIIALPPGVYDLNFELAGFQTVKRENIRVVINQTLAVDQQLNVATLQETVTVTGESPVVDTTTTTMGTNFTKELLTEIPNARDVWAAMSQAPGIQMMGYDVGGSHAGTQTGFVTYGLDVQNQTKIEGVDTTEGNTANAGYFDFGSFEEFQVGGAGSDAGNFAAGASLSISVKSGGDRFSGNWYSDWLGANTISNNLPDNLRVANSKDENGFFVRTPLTVGNPVDHQYDVNFNVGGPLWKKRAWWFYSYRLDDQYKVVLGFPELARSKLTNDYTFKGTFQLNRNNQIIGFYNKRNKLQDKRDFGPTTPLSAARYQASKNYPGKIEWTSVLNSSMFLDVLYGEWGNFFPLRPTIEQGIYSGPWGPGRQDLANNQRFDGGANNAYQDQKRYKPQFYVALSYFKTGWKGNHDFKFGFDKKQDKRNFFQDQPFDIFYRDQGGLVNQVDIYNTPVSPINTVDYTAGWFSDTWRYNDRLTINYGGRLEYYKDGWPEQNVTPNGVPVLASWNDPTYRAFIAPKTVAATTVAESTTFAPRAGFAYDLLDDNRTVLKVFYGQFRFNSADTLADQQNPVAKAQLRYRFNDLNGNRLLDGPQELNGLVQTVGGGGFVTVDPNLTRPTSNEISTSVEHEIRQGLSGRVSYVYKNIRNQWNEVDAARIGLYTVPFNFNDVGNDGLAGTSDDKALTLLDLPTGSPSNRVYTNPDGLGSSDFNTVEVALNRRFAGKWMLLTSFGYTWFNQLHQMTSATGNTAVAGNSRATGDNFTYRPSQLMFGDNGYENSSNWNYKIIGRYVMPYEIGFSGSWKVQNGNEWGRVTSVTFPGDGAQNIRMEPVNSNRAPTVGIMDIRVDKSIKFGKFGKVTGQIDVFNLMNSGTVTVFRTTTSSTQFKEVLGILDPRVVRFGVRFDF